MNFLYVDIDGSLYQTDCFIVKNTKTRIGFDFDIEYSIEMSKTTITYKSKRLRDAVMARILQHIRDLLNPSVKEDPIFNFKEVEEECKNKIRNEIHEYTT